MIFIPSWHLIITARPITREQARKLWIELGPKIEALDTTRASEMVRGFIADTAEFWKDITFEQYQKEVLEDPKKAGKDPKEKKEKKKKTK